MERLALEVLAEGAVAFIVILKCNVAICRRKSAWTDSIPILALADRQRRHREEL